MNPEVNDERPNLWRVAAWSAGVLVLLVPLFAMQFGDEVAWTVGDFVFAGVLVLGVGLAFELTLRKTDDTPYRAAVGLALAATFLLVWMNAAVGIIGSAANDANMLYGGVIAVGVIGALLARFRPYGMARAMVGAALVQALVPWIAFLVHDPTSGPVAWGAVLGATVFFVALWLASAELFRRAEGEGDGGPHGRKGRRFR